MAAPNTILRCASIVFLVLLLVAVTSAPALAAAPFKPKSFALALGMSTSEQSTTSALSEFDLVVVDGETTSADEISLLKRDGALVIGYVSVGTIERDRPWFTKSKKYRLDYWGDWGEWYANVNKSGFRKIIANEVAPSMLSKGFDGLFLDNVDMIASHRKQTPGMKKLVGKLSDLTSSHNSVLYAQNGDDVIKPFIPMLDGWNREDVTSTYNFEKHRYEKTGRADHRQATKTIQKLKRKGLVVTTTDYVAASDQATMDLAVGHSCSIGAIPFVSDSNLTRIPATEYRTCD